MHREQLGRLVGLLGAAIALLFWGMALVAIAGELVTGVAALGIPLVLLASLQVAFAAADAALLARRVEVGIPWTLAASHVVIALALLGLGHAWGIVCVLVAIAATQMIALWLFGQITPSHASSQR